MSGRSLFLAVRRVLQLQALTILAVSTLTLLLGGMEQARSALLGGLVGFLPNAYFAFKFGRSDPRRTAREVVRTFYLGESIKLIITALLFVFVFQLPGILFMPLFIGFVSVIMVFWFALLLGN
ncbi:MAG TPA: ATP synthase subunit I [Methylococcaceae bacterium]|jgi:ATP synthase protein I|nr:ATP synthase subunit I [Methylococcaceae bacterium]